MSIEIDWEVSEAPSGDDGASTTPPAYTPPPSGQPPLGATPEEQTPSRWRSRWWLAIPVVLVLIGAFGLNYITRLGWQRINDEVTALVRYEEQMASRGEILLVLRVQDYTNSQWLTIRSNQVAANQPAPLPVPVLAPVRASAAIGPLEIIGADWVRAEVLRQYQTPDGHTVTFALPQFYRRPGRSEDWVRTGVPDTYWGNWRDWHSPHLFVRHSQRDQALVDRIGPRLETLLSQACQLWGTACADLPSAKLFLSGFVGSLEYDPLQNVRVRVEFGDAESANGLPADYFLSVPSPQLAGEPADAATEEYLTHYLAVRLIAALADSATTTNQDAATLTAEAVTRLGLHNADPGFATAGYPPLGGEALMYSLLDTTTASAVAAAAPVKLPAPGVTLVTSLRPTVELVTYEVQPGDTLWGIATNYAVSVEAIARLNGLENPDLLPVGARLLIPRGATE